MSTSKPRITVTLTDRQHEVLRSISVSSGQSMSSLLGEVIETTLPVFERMAVTFQHIKRAREEERAKIAKTLDEAQDAFEPIAASLVGQFDMFMGRLESGIASTAAEPRGAGGALPQPKTPPTNRGVTPSRAKPSKPNNGKASRSVSASRVSRKKGV